VDNFCGGIGDKVYAGSDKIIYPLWQISSGMINLIENMLLYKTLNVALNTSVKSDIN